MCILLTDYKSRADDIRSVREAVFVVEQAVEREEEFDGRDAECMHVVICDGEQPVATGRIDMQRQGKVGRVAVVRTHRRRGLGTRVMQALEQYAREQKGAKVWFHAQMQAVAFYESLGYEVTSDQFDEANIPHVVMEKRL